MNLLATVAEPSPPPESPGTMKFVYASGSRPLDGYTIKRGIGRGGFGEVYYATSDGGKEVALKLIRRNLDVELRGVGQCLNLKHQNLVNLFDTKRDDQDNSWVIMEYVRGESLEDVISRHPDGLPEDELRYWLGGIAAGVAYLHDRGIVHRDLKPGNIFDDEGLVKIGDYGLSKFISASRRSGQTESVGTVHYMAPEIANGRYGKEIDVYALGVILYEMLTGRVPFEGESVGEVLMKHLTAEPDLSPIPDPYRGVIARALTKDPQQRFNSVQELMAALADGTAASANGAPRPQPPGAKPGKPAKPKRGDDDFYGLFFEFGIGRGKPKKEGAEQASTERGSGGPAKPSRLKQFLTRPEEPIWKAIRETAARLRNNWQKADLPRPLRIFLIVMLAFALTGSAPFWIPVLCVLSILYGIYYVVRLIVLPDAGSVRPLHEPLPPKEKPTLPHPGDAAAHKRPAHRAAAHRVRRSHVLLREKAAALPLKTPRQKTTELFGSLLVSSLVSTALALTIALVFSAGESSEYLWQKQFTWMALVGTAGAWGILIPSKFWEGREGEPIMRRFTLFCVGLGLGAGAFLLADVLKIELPHNSKHFGRPFLPFDWKGGEAILFDQQTYQPTWRLYLAYFGFLFPIIRWWKLADPFRWARFSLWSTGVCIFWAGILFYAWPFTQPWGILAASTIAVSVQLAAPWTSEEEQKKRMALAA